MLGRLTLTVQKRGCRQSIQISISASQTARNETDSANQQIATASKAKSQASQPTRILNRSDNAIEMAKQDAAM